MAYTTIALVRAATGMNDATNIPDATITAKISGADGVINGKIGNVYTLPLASTPNLIGYLSLEITICLLFMDQYGEESEDKDKSWKKRYDLAIDMLTEIHDGKTKLFNDTTGLEYPGTDLMSPTGYPTAASSLPEATDSTAPKTTMNQRF